jgi:lysophospholipase L1-like esterase
MSLSLKPLPLPALCVAALCLALCPVAGARAQAPDASAATMIPAITPTDRLSVDWWAARHKAILADLPKHSDAQLLLVGDSITSNYDKAEPPNEDFQPIWQQYYAPRKALNLGFGGDTTANVLWRLDHGEVKGLHPKLAVVLIGTNNTATGQTAEDTELGIDAVVKDLEHRLPETKILLVGILPSKLPSRELNFDVNGYLGSHYAGGEDPQVSYIDISVVFYPHGELDASLFYDSMPSQPKPATLPKATYPNARGQRLMASAIEPAVARLMGDTPVKPLETPAATVAAR